VKKLLLLLAVIVGVAALVSWPRISDVETGRSPEYPDLQVREYAASEEQVVKAVKEAVGRLPGWTWLGSGRGPAGSAVTALRSAPILPLKDEVTVKIQRGAGRTRVSVRSRSRWGKLDFGQNARNIRALLAELDRELR
jgi:uncharacterized protein (DUF1499 family)